MPSERTIIRTLDIPAVPGWKWYGDFNIVGVSVHLDCEGRQRALREMQARWLEEHAALVDS